MSPLARVLAAEDSPTQAAMLRGHLEAAGFGVSMAANGAEALSMLHREAFDVVVSDVVMPELDGYGLSREAKRLAPTMPVMLLTSLSDPMDIINALSSGADGFLRKPYKPAELIQRVRRLLDGHRQDIADPDSEIFLSGQAFKVNAGRPQILDLLVSTFEELASVNDELRGREQELVRANARVAARLAETELERQRLRSVLGAIPQAMAVVDAHATIVYANEALASLLGIPSGSLVGAPIQDVVQFTDQSGSLLPADRRGIWRALTSGETAALGTAFDLFVLRADGSKVPAIKRTAPICDPSGHVVGAVGVIEDIGSLLAYDATTGLPGHGVLIDRLDTAMEAAAESGDITGLLALKVDRFDRIREGMPPRESEQLIAMLAEALRRQLDSDRVHQRCTAASAASLGKDELVVILPQLQDEADAFVVAELLAAELSGAVEISETEVAITVSVAVGIADRAGDPATLLGAVAAAARRASTEGGGHVTGTNPLLHAEVVERLQRESQLRTAISDHQLVVHYQPQIDLRSRQAVAVEALVRWQHPDRGLLGADQIIPLAIESGLIAPLGWEVLTQACRQAAEWRRGGLPLADRLILSVNLATEQLLEPDVQARIAQILAESGLDPMALVLEVTEGSLMTQRVASAQRLAEIKTLGVQIAIDDFGTGYSSLVHLRDLPVDVLKVDRTFVSGMIDKAADAAIVTGTVVLARALGLEIIAEGVESADQAEALLDLGCNLGQGYHWARPMPAFEIADWWDRHAAAMHPSGQSDR